MMTGETEIGVTMTYKKREKKYTYLVTMIIMVVLTYMYSNINRYGTIVLHNPGLVEEEELLLSL